MNHNYGHAALRVHLSEVTRKGHRGWKGLSVAIPSFLQSGLALGLVLGFAISLFLVQFRIGDFPVEE